MRGKYVGWLQGKKSLLGTAGHLDIWIHSGCDAMQKPSSHLKKIDQIPESGTGREIWYIPHPHPWLSIYWQILATGKGSVFSTSTAPDKLSMLQWKTTHP